MKDPSGFSGPMICGLVRRIAAAISDSHIPVNQCHLLATPTQWKHQRRSNVNILKSKKAILLHCLFTEELCEYSIRFRLKSLPAQVHKSCHLLKLLLCAWVWVFCAWYHKLLYCSRDETCRLETSISGLHCRPPCSKIPFFMFVCSDDMFQRGLPADCDVNSSHSWSEATCAVEHYWCYARNIEASL